MRRSDVQGSQTGTCGIIKQLRKDGTAMMMENRGAKAAHLEELATRMTEIDTRPIDGHLLGMQEKVV